MLYEVITDFDMGIAPTAGAQTRHPGFGNQLSQTVGQAQTVLVCPVEGRESLPLMIPRLKQQLIPVT